MEKMGKIRLESIIKTNQSNYSTKEKWSFVNYLDTGNIIKNKIDTIQYIDLKENKLPSRAKRKVSYNNIIYSTVRPNQLHYGIIKEQPKNFLVSTGFTVIEVDTKVAIPDYIYYVLSQDEITEQLQAIGEQGVSAYPSIKPSDIENLEILLPSIEIQEKIVSVLSSIDNKISINDKINNNLLEIAMQLYKNWFLDFIPFSTNSNIPNGWRLGKISDIVNILDSKRKPISGNVRDKMKKIYPYYGAASLMDYVDDYLFDGVYLLLGEDGTVMDSNGFPILQYVEGKFWVNNHAHILEGKNGFSVEMLFLLFSLTNIKSIVTGAVQPKISQSNLKNIDIFIPPKDVLYEFDTIIQPVFSKIRSLRNANKILSNIRDSLITNLLSGKIDVSNIDI